MELITLQDVLKAANAELVAHKPDEHPGFTSVSIDSRNVEEGALFFAIKGERFDGHDFVAQAARSGAGAAVISNEWYGKHHQSLNPEITVLLVDDTIEALQTTARFYREKFSIPVISVTGSNGKTTTKDMAARLLATRYKVLKTRGNKNNYIGLPLTLFNLDSTYEAAVIEMGMSIPGEIALLTGLARPGIGIITTVAPAHLEVLKTVEKVAEAKTEMLFTMDKKGTGILNADNELLMSYKDKSPVKIKTFGIDQPADLRAKDIKPLAGGGYCFTATNGMDISIPVLGRCNIYNALAALAATGEYDLDKKDVQEALASFKSEKLRLDRFTADGITWINDTYNANPASMQAAFSILKDLEVKGKRIAVLGDMLELGEASSQLHYEVGRQAAEVPVDHLFAFGPESKYYVGGALKAGMDKQAAVYFTDKEKLVQALKDTASAGDLVLVKGSRGMAMEEVFKLLGINLNIE